MLPEPIIAAFPESEMRGKEKVPVKKLWDETANGVFFCPMIGRKAVLLDGKHNSIKVESPKALGKIIDVLITKTNAGEYDAALEAALARVSADAQKPSSAPSRSQSSEEEVSSSPL